MSFDVFGDIHGHAEQLEILLQKCGYERRGGVYRHPESRKALFVGDLIDRGPRIRETLHLVKDMCDEGHAMVVMGNHEFNAICFHTPHTETGGFFRDHTLAEIEQHIETLRQFRHFEKEWTYFLEWFKTTPLFLDLDKLRIVHACWDPAQISWLKENYKGIDEEFLRLANDKRNRKGLYTIVNDTLKGKEYRLPEGYTFADKGGVIRSECRVRWWQPKSVTMLMGQYLFDCPQELREKEVPNDLDLFTYNDELPVFFGHYWLQGTPVIENPRAICLDYSVAKHGKLAACRVDFLPEGTSMKIIY